MALFDKFRATSSSNASFTLQEATGGVLLSVIASDGHISDEEAEFFSLVANRHPIFKDQPAAQFNAMVDKMFGLLKRGGWRDLVEKCGRDLPKEFRPTVFALAVDFVLADGNVEDEEKNLIAFLKERLEIPESVVDNTIDVLAVKNGLS